VSALRALMECGFTAADACTKRALASLSMQEASLALNASDAASTAILLDRMGASNAHACSSRIAHSLLTQQNTDGGWSFTKTSEPSTRIASLPCADALQLQDPSRVDITGSVLECFAARAITIDHASVRDAIAYLKSAQHADGSWADPEGKNKISNTTLAVSGAIGCGANPAEPWLQRAADWITSIQKTDGSFSDSTAHNHEQPSTASATAAAATLLLELQGKDDRNLHRAIEWLCTTQLNAASAADPLSNPNQTPAGSWSQPHATTAVLPGLPTARNHSAALHLATTALGKFLAAHGAGVRGKRLTDRSVRAALLG
jgi:squalene cyclase